MHAPEFLQLAGHAHTSLVNWGESGGFHGFFSGQDTFYWTFFVISFPFLDSVE
jgi:hypothetical protein